MADYQKMYSMLFNKITDMITELQQIQIQTEELYIQSEEREEALASKKAADQNKSAD